MTSFQFVAEKLQSSDYKLTRQRKIVVRALIENSGKHLSAEELHSFVRKCNPEIGLATVYRTLEILAQIEVIHKLELGDGRARYELSSGNVHRHHHLICLGCGSVTELNEDLLENLERLAAEKHNFRVSDHDVKVYGYCSRCQRATLVPPRDLS